MDIQELEFSKHSYFLFLRSAEQFRRYSSNYWQSQLLKKTGGFAPFLAQPYGVLGQGTLL